MVIPYFFSSDTVSVTDSLYRNSGSSVLDITIAIYSSPYTNTIWKGDVSSMRKIIFTIEDTEACARNIGKHCCNIKSQVFQFLLLLLFVLMRAYHVRHCHLSVTVVLNCCIYN